MAKGRVRPNSILFFSSIFYRNFHPVPSRWICNSGHSGRALRGYTYMIRGCIYDEGPFETVGRDILWKSILPVLFLRNATVWLSKGMFAFLHIFRVDALFLKYQCTDTVGLPSTPALYVFVFILILNSKKTYCRRTLLVWGNMMHILLYLQLIN